jgi:hypothetical protein
MCTAQNMGFAGVGKEENKIVDNQHMYFLFFLGFFIDCCTSDLCNSAPIMTRNSVFITTIVTFLFHKVYA